MDNHTPQINGALLRMRREELGWALADLATRACLSNKQVKQIEEGGTSSFYSDTVKMTAAKKIGGILGLPEQSVFVVEEPEVVLEEVTTQEETPSPTADAVHADRSASDSDKTQAVTAPSAAGHDSNAIQEDIASPAVKPYLKSPSIETTVIQKSTNSALDSEDKPKSKNSLWFIIALFVAALGLAAVMQQPASTPPAEPPPPIQVLPPEAADPAASAPSAPSAAASGAVPVAPTVAPAPAASSVTSVSPAASGTAPVSATPTARPAVATTSSPATTPPAPAASMAPSAAPTTQAAPAAPSKPQ
jgi:transcriptional regulator with XRE-family HTH domain